MTAARRPLRSALPGLLLLLGLAWLAYLPGLTGGFLFDDFINLDKLNSPGRTDNWPAFWRYITSGEADPIGRPLSMLSFLIDAREWPADPSSFLRTNVLLHLANGALLFVLLRNLGRQVDGAIPRTDFVAMLAAGLWLLHPLFVSTTLYVVQREAMLPATFTLLGLIVYVHGRCRLAAAPRAGSAWMVAGIALGTTLAALSKANGVLLPLLAWVLELTVLRNGVASHIAPMSRSLRMALLVLPSLGLLTYIGSFLLGLNDPLPHRTWTIGQRLMTEPRILLDYLQLLVVPRVLSTGLYNDSYVASTGLLVPFSTLPSLAIVVALAVSGFVFRKRAPVLSAALLFFFAGHALESTAIPLELYFEHRNYLPAMLLFWPLSRVVCGWKASIALRVGAAAGLLAICGLTTWQRADVWGQPSRMALLWAAQNQGSSRAQATASMFEAREGRAHAAMQRLGPLWRQQPHDLQLALNYINAACAVRGLTPGDVSAVSAAFRNNSGGAQLIHRWLDRALDIAAKNSCPGLTLDSIQAWMDSTWGNPLLSTQPGIRQDLHSLAGRLALKRNQPRQALVAFNQALAAKVRPEAAAKQVVLLATDGHYAQALAHLDYYEHLASRKNRKVSLHMRQLHEFVLAHQHYWPHEMAILRAKLVAEITAESARVSSAQP